MSLIVVFPAQEILGRGGMPELIGWVSPLVGFAFLGVCLLVFQVGLRHYASTGS